MFQPFTQDVLIKLLLLSSWIRRKAFPDNVACVLLSLSDLAALAVSNCFRDWPAVFCGCCVLSCCLCFCLFNLLFSGLFWRQIELDVVLKRLPNALCVLLNHATRRLARPDLANQICDQIRDRALLANYLIENRHAAPCGLFSVLARFQVKDVASLLQLNAFLCVGDGAHRLDDVVVMAADCHPYIHPLVPVGRRELL